jgi:hypothetical protein
MYIFLVLEKKNKMYIIYTKCILAFCEAHQERGRTLGPLGKDSMH